MYKRQHLDHPARVVSSRAALTGSPPGLSTHAHPLQKPTLVTLDELVHHVAHHIGPVELQLHSRPVVLDVGATPNDLERAAGMLFKPKAGAEITELTGVRVQGGAVEGSNVNAVRELTDMIMASRIYDSFTKVSESSSKMSEIRNQKIGSTQG